MDIISDKIKLLSSAGRFEKEKNAIETLSERIHTIISNRINSEKTDLNFMSEKIEALSPMRLLHRGYSVVQKNSNTISSVTQVLSGDKLTIKVSDGMIECCVENINNNGE